VCFVRDVWWSDEAVRSRRSGQPIFWNVSALRKWGECSSATVQPCNSVSRGEVAGGDEGVDVDGGAIIKRARDWSFGRGADRSRLGM